MKKKLLLVATAMLLSAQMWAAYDFSAVCSSGQTLYYMIAGTSPCTAIIVCPDNGSDGYSNYIEPTGNLVIPNTVTYNGTTYTVISIGDHSFYNCTGLTSVIIGDSLKTVGYSAFEGCSGMTSVTIGNSVTSIWNSAFEDCSALTSVTIPNSVTSVGNSAFKYCERLTSAVIGNSVTTIEENTFYGCYWLKSVIIGNSVTSIGQYSFGYCSKLANINWDAVNVTDLSKRAFECCDSLTNVVFGNSVMYVPEKAFTYKPIKTVSFGTSPAVIGKEAFANCPNLNSVSTGNVVTIGESAFCNCTALTNLNIGDSLRIIGKSAFGSCSGLTSLKLGKSVTSIGYGAFQSCIGLTKLKISDSVDTIGDVAFKFCVGLSSINIGESVASIGHQAFGMCYSLRKIKVCASTPPSLYASTFEGIEKDIDVIVKCGYESAYQSAQYWSEFTNISEGITFEFECIPNHTWLGTIDTVIAPTCDNGGEVKIQAIPISDAYFARWSDGVLYNPRTFTLTQDTTLIAIFESLTGVNENDTPETVSVYPNPTEGTFTIEMENIIGVEIFGLAGQKVLTDKSGSQTINAGSLPTGVYFLKVETQNGTKYGKLIKK